MLYHPAAMSVLPVPRDTRNRFAGSEGESRRLYLRNPPKQDELDHRNFEKEKYNGWNYSNLFHRYCTRWDGGF